MNTSNTYVRSIYIIWNGNAHWLTNSPAPDGLQGEGKGEGTGKVQILQFTIRVTEAFESPPIVHENSVPLSSLVTLGRVNSLTTPLGGFVTLSNKSPLPAPLTWRAGDPFLLVLLQMKVKLSPSVTGFSTGVISNWPIKMQLTITRLSILSLTIYNG